MIVVPDSKFPVYEVDEQDASTSVFTFFEAEDIYYSGSGKVSVA